MVSLYNPKKEDLIATTLLGGKYTYPILVHLAHSERPVSSIEFMHKFKSNWKFMRDKIHMLKRMGIVDFVGISKDYGNPISVTNRWWNIRSKKGELIMGIYEEAYKKNGKIMDKAALTMGISRSQFRNKFMQEVGMPLLEYKLYNTKLSLKNQRLMDTQRMERKELRLSNRENNILEGLNQNLIEAISKIEKPKIKKYKGKKKVIKGVLHLSDLHINEQVNLTHNQYNIEIAGKRLRKHVLESIKFFKSEGVTDVVVAMTGDITNANKHLDELLLNATPLAIGVVIAFDIIRQIIEELSKDFNVSVLSIWGNESRLTKDVGFIPTIASDNFDSTIYKLLQLHFNKAPIKFIGEASEMVVDIAGNNILCIHGHSFKGNLEIAIQKVVAKYTTKGTIIDYTLSGHIHSAYASSTFSRSGSVTGDNNYNYNNLNISGRASQNAYIFGKGVRKALVIDLQDTTGVQGYKVSKGLNIKSTITADQQVPVVAQYKS